MSASTARPLLDNSTDARFFSGRTEDLARLERAVGRNANALIVGPRGAGKTSLLRMLQLRLRDQGRTVVFIDGRSVDDVRSVLRRVLERLGEVSGAPQPGWWRDEADVLDLVAQLTATAGVMTARRDRGPVVLCDELPSAETGHTLFGRLRDDLWMTGLTWVLAVPSVWEPVVLEPPADAFFEVTVTLAPLTIKDAEALVRLRVGGSLARQLTKVIRAGALEPPQTPRALLQLAVAAAETSVEEAATRAGRPDPIADLPRPEAMLVAELRWTGPASASDSQLLARLGWTRSRAVQVLRALADKGVVAGYDVPNPKGGRPLKRYRLTEGWL
ncbi:MAG TPA: AAA family ATPase [Acidimicrobiales bacterium]|jgi:energy-coupling factor transporter ATP-binding protein EcfA2